MFAKAQVPNGIAIGVWFLVLNGLPIGALGQVPISPKYVRNTVTYKASGPLEIKADVLRPDDESPRAVLVWIHGGALINGHRESIPGRLVRAAQERGLALVSLDYRLAPETKLPEIIADVEDAFRWIRGDGARVFHLDPERIAVAGGSAGGYLTLVTGYRVQPPPRVLIAFWGYGDLIGEWYSRPSPHPRHNRVPVTRTTALRQVGGSPISDSRHRNGNGGLFYLYCRQKGLWPQEVTGWDPHLQQGRFVPFMPVRNVTADYPPTCLIHGTEDTDVPHEQSMMMAKQFERLGVEHILELIPDAEHGLAGGDHVAIEAAYSRAWEFLDKSLGED